MVPFSPVSSFQHLFLFLFFFNDTATTEIYTLSLHDALPISSASPTVIWNCTTSWCAPALFRRFSWTSKVPSELLLVRKQSGSSAARATCSNCCVSRFISHAASGVNTGGLLANHWRIYRSCLTMLPHFQLVWMPPIAARCPVRIGIDFTPPLRTIFGAADPVQNKRQKGSGKDNPLRYLTCPYSHSRWVGGAPWER